MRAKRTHSDPPWSRYMTQDGTYHIRLPDGGSIDFVGKNARENAIFVSAIHDLFGAAIIGIKALEETVQAVGGCDHANNVCSCGPLSDLRFIVEAVKKAKGERL